MSRPRELEAAPLLLVTCSRTWSDWATPTVVFRTALLLHPGAVLLHGGAVRGDRQLATIWTNLGGDAHTVPAEWDKCGLGCPTQPHRRRNSSGRDYCPLAGYRRNQAMVDMRPNWAVAFIHRNSSGATDCLRRITVAGVPHSVYRET